MKRIIILTTMLAALTTLFSCEKTLDDGEVPMTLKNTTWSNSPKGEQTIIEFKDGDNAIYTVNIEVAGKMQTKAKIEYTYTYTKPQVTLTPKKGNGPLLAGYVANHGANSNTLNLRSTDNAIDIHLTQNVGK